MKEKLRSIWASPTLQGTTVFMAGNIVVSVGFAYHFYWLDFWVPMNMAFWLPYLVCCILFKSPLVLWIFDHEVNI